MPTVLLTRHGETTWNREGRVQGWAPTPLTDRGREQAAALAAHLGSRDVDSLHASDLKRARTTADYVADATGLDPVHDVGWRERDFGVLQGLLAEDLYENHPEFDLLTVGPAAARERPDSGESFVDTQERALARYRELRSSLGPDETAVVVAHGGTIKLLLGAVKGLELKPALLDQSTDNCSIAEVDVGTGDDPTADTVVSENRTDFVDGA
jgi:probable phosphoglycerate mutase